MIHIYCGNGKGKTTAAIGLSVRAAGAGVPILFGQFLKDKSSSEICVLEDIKSIRIFHGEKNYGFTWELTERERKLQRQINDKILMDMELSVSAITKEENMAERDNEVKAVVVFDEVIHALNDNLLDEKKLYTFMGKYKNKCEIILTGTNPPDKLTDMADYISCINKIKHPFDKGTGARKGIEY